MAEDDFVLTPEEMATLNGVAISPWLMHSILTRFMALPEDECVGPDTQLAGLLTVCNALDVPGDKELVALVAHADRFQQRVCANASLQATTNALPKRARGRHPHRTGTAKPGRHAAERSH